MSKQLSFSTIHGQAQSSPQYEEQGVPAKPREGHPGTPGKEHVKTIHGQAQSLPQCEDRVRTIHGQAQSLPQYEEQEKAQRTLLQTNEGGASRCPHHMLKVRWKTFSKDPAR